MGESTFDLWCADAGIIANGSKIDKTGWDYYVEFPFHKINNPLDLHKSAFECKVQVKATDKKERKLQITISNLRRLITAQMPAFLLFLEFDKKSLAQRAFLFHIDSEMTTKVLKRIRELGENEKLNKHKMTIHYNEAHLLPQANGESLKQEIIRHIGETPSTYVAKKIEHLASTGFEDGFAQINFTTEGKQELIDLIDVSIGKKKSVDIKTFKGFYTRFGIKENSPFLDCINGRLEMPEPPPAAEGTITFKEDSLSIGSTYGVKIYSSPFNQMIPQHLVKIRAEGEFFEITMNPFAGNVNFSFSIGEEKRMRTSRLRDALKSIKMLSEPGSKSVCELEISGLPVAKFSPSKEPANFNFSEELTTAERASYLASEYGLQDIIEISLEEISHYSDEIEYLHRLHGNTTEVKIEFTVNDESFDPTQPVVCIFTTAAPLGSHILGAIASITGKIDTLREGEYSLTTEKVTIIKKIATPENKPINGEALNLEIKAAAEKYNKEGLSTVIISSLEPNNG